MRKFITLNLIIAVIVGLNSCKNGPLSIQGSGPMVEKTLDLDEFHGVNLQSSYNIEVVYGATQSVVVYGQQNIIDRLEFDIVGGILNADIKRGNYKNLDLTLKITSPMMNYFRISGSGDMSIDGFTNLDDMEALISGSGNIKTLSALSIADNLNVQISGSGTIDLSGYADNQNVEVSGSGEVNCFGLNTEACDVKISGSGNVRVFVNSTLDAKIPGSGNIYYKGNPVVTKSISGSGNVIDNN